MSSPTAVSFDSDFLLICRELSIGWTDDVIQRRWTGASSLARAVTRPTLDALIRIAFGIRDVKGSCSAEWLRDQLVKADAAFSLVNNDRELQLMGAAGLLALYITPTEMTISAALGAVTSSLGRQRVLHLPCDILARAERVLHEQSERVRTRVPTSSPQIGAAISAAFQNAGQGFQQGGQDATAAFTQSLEGSRIAIQAVLESLDVLQTSLSARDEELDILWWLVGGRTSFGGRRFGDVAHSAQPLLFARDLAALTKLLPGPPSISSILARATSEPHETCSVAECVNICDLEWIERSLKADPSPVCQPIHFALSRRLETRDDSSWIPGWQAQTQLDPPPP